MLKYQIHKLSKGGKEAQTVLLEDILTSDVFGLMSYFPYDLLLKPFLHQVTLKNPKSAFSPPAIAPSQVGFWQSLIWPTALPKLGRESIEPDVLIEWNDTLLIVEAKFLSPTDPEELLREFLVGLTRAGSNQQFFLLLIDKNLSPASVVYRDFSAKTTTPEYIEGRISELKLSETIAPEQVTSSFLWMNWQTFYALARGLIEKNVFDDMGGIGEFGKRMLSDLLLILERKGLIPFEALSLKSFQQYHIDLSSLGQIGVMMRNYLAELPDIFIDIDTLGYIGLMLSDFLQLLSALHLDLNSLGEVGLIMRSSYCDLSDISIDLTALGKIGLMLSDPVQGICGIQLHADALSAVLGLKNY
jgi:hypothetical protein